jgi:hypothetical protein
VPIVYAVSVVLLGIVGPGGVAAGALTALLAWLLAPQLEAIGGGRGWIATGVAFAASVLLLAVGMATVRSSPEHPTPSQIVYALDSDSSDAWLAARGQNASQLIVLKGSSATPPAWLTRAFGSGRSVLYTPVQRVVSEPPIATVLGDSTVANERRVLLRIRPPSGTETISLRANDTRVLRAAIDGRAIDMSRYRGGVRLWRLDYTAPPDTGITLTLTVPAGSAISLDVLARSPGVPSLAAITPVTRPADVVTVQGGDVTVVHRTLYIP